MEIRAYFPTWPATSHEFVETFWREIETAFPCNGWPSIQIKVAEFILIADFRCCLISEYGVFEIDGAIFSRGEVRGQRSEVRGQRSDVVIERRGASVERRGHGADNGGWRSWQMADGSWQRTGVRAGNLKPES